MTPTFTELPPDDRGYPGMTRYTAPDGRMFACVGVGEAARAKLIERARKAIP